jgi:hypothetical protein
MRLLRAVGPLTLIGVAATAALVAVTGGAPTTVVAVAASTSAASFTVVTAAALASAALGFRFDDGLEGFVVWQQLDKATTLVLVARLDDRQDFHPVEHLLGLDLYDVTD